MHLFLVLACLFIFIPVIEISLLVRVYSAIGFPGTVLIVLGTGVIGAALARKQGARAWANVRAALREGRAPSKELFDGFCILCAGLLLVTPGLLTDCTGFLLLVPPFRKAVRSALARHLVGSATVVTPGFSFSGRPSGAPPPALSAAGGERGHHRC